MGVPDVMYTAITSRTIPPRVVRVDILNWGVKEDNYTGENFIEGNQASKGDSIRITGTGAVTSTLNANGGFLTFFIYFPTGGNPIGTLLLPVGRINVQVPSLTTPAITNRLSLFFEFLLTYASIGEAGSVGANGMAFLGAGRPAFRSTCPTPTKSTLPTTTRSGSR